MKITLVNLPLSAEEQAGSLKGVANILPPLGIGYIAAVLLENGFDVKIIDCRPLNITTEQLVEQLKQEQPDIIGITATVLEAQKAIELSKVLKEETSALLVIGGCHFTSMPEEMLKQSDFDIGIYAEGEITFLELAKAVRDIRQGVKNAMNINQITGIYYKSIDGTIKFTGMRDYITDLDTLPFPARQLYPTLDKYTPVPASYIKLPLGHLMSSRGCPNQCIFCDRKVFGNKYRARKVERVVDEIEELINVYGAKEIRFFDDTLTLDPARVFALCDEMDKRNIHIPWSCLSRTNNVSLELFKRMKKSGCWQVSFGLESGDQRMLDIMKKGTTVKQNEDAVKWAHKAGMNTRAFFVLGLPGETMNSMNNSIRFAKRLPLDVVTFYSLALYPGNELWNIAKREGKIIHSDFSQYNPIIDVHTQHLAYIPDGLTEDQIRRTISRAHKSFYLRPAYIFRQLISIRNFSDIKRYWLGLKTILRI